MLGDFGLAGFHMADCANGAPPFDRFTKDQRIKVETEAIAIIKETIAYGFAVTLNPGDFTRIVPRSPEIGSPYSLCVHTCLTGVRGWANQFNFKGSISYVFEAGHRSQGEANGIMIRIFKKPNLRSEHRYAGHTFARIKGRASTSGRRYSCVAMVHSNQTSVGKEEASSEERLRRTGA